MKTYSALLMLVLLSSCAIYDSKRGPLVTSSSITVASGGYPSSYTISIPEFQMPSNERGASITTTSLISGLVFDVSHEYIFNEVDQSNIHKSLVQSLISSGVTLTSSAEKNLEAHFDFVGMVEAGYGYVVPFFKGTLTLEEAGKKSHLPFEVKGERKSTVIGSKESGIKKFVSVVHDFLHREMTEFQPNKSLQPTANASAE